MINRIRNANAAKKYNVEVVKSKITLQIAEILKKEGFIESFQSSTDVNDHYIVIRLKYKGLQQLPYIRNLTIVSKPGSRVYMNKNNIPRVLGGVGVAVRLFRF
jgi:small subunit ribosomal protein S8